MRFDLSAVARSAAGLLAVAGLAATLHAAPAAAAGKQNFDLVNQTGYTISEVYVSPSKSSDWEEDVMGRDVLRNGETVEIIFDRSAKTCIWDLMVVYDDGETAEWNNFDLCTISVIAISYNRKTGETWAEWQ